ncbi:hypothetical protein BDF21DRAFT_423407 [Thamnidium elegans]|uniref:Glycosyltransferase 61 catalytic domain-containing protein n=1 Tax=Thamnidium elegans TaxID=101142 RepID=A0A8H7SLE5_9FUNG|nr:hypothetical protein INT48_001534 [Thamnidium elegans]KAI8075662.1 hypothetical protein BDF21DRAFT_423407 [Thamnidium elegans]
MIYLKKYIPYLFLILLSLYLLLYISWQAATTETIEQSSWSCQGEGRNTICEFTNFCVDSKTGPFIIHADRQPPKLNLINADEDGDMWFEPKRVDRPVKAIRMHQTLFVYGLYSPFHFSHFLYNGLIPLYSTMLEYGMPPNAWTMRALTHWTKNTRVDLIVPSHKDIVFDSKDVLTEKQVEAGYQTMCFSKAVVGTGNRCSLWHCDRHIPAAHYASFKEYVFTKAHQRNNTCLTSIVHHTSAGKYRVGILNRKSTRHITNVPELIDRLQKEGDFDIRSIDFDQSACDIVHTAQAVKDLDILIAPFGNGLGAGLFMKDDAVVVSISARWYSEDWFKYAMTAVGRRIFNFECGRAECQEYEPALAASILENYNVTLNATEMQAFMTEQYPEKTMRTYLPGREWNPILQYQKDVARRVDVESFIPYLRMIIKNKPPKGVAYPDACNQENVCCDTKCKGPLDRNVRNELGPWQEL